MRLKRPQQLKALESILTCNPLIPRTQPAPLLSLEVAPTRIPVSDCAKGVSIRNMVVGLCRSYL